MSQQQQQQRKELKMGPLDLALYGVILCIHYPLKLTFATYRTSKAAVVTTVSLPRRTLNYTFSTISSVKQTAENSVRGTINFVRNRVTTTTNLVRNTTSAATNLVHNTSSAATNLVHNTTSAATNLVHNTTSAATNVVHNTTSAATNAVHNTTSAGGNIVRRSTSAATNLVRNTASIGINITRNSFAYAFNLFNKAKVEANHQFETKINEPKLQYERALAETANSISDYTVSTANAVKQNAEGNVRRGINFVRNVAYISFDTLKQLTEDVHEQADYKHAEPKSRYQQSLATFQAAAFETERQSLKSEILKLNEELKRGSQRTPGFDKERLKCDKQIHDLQEQLTRIHLTYTQQKQQLLSEFDKERQQYTQEVQKLNHQVIQSQVSYEHLSKQQVTGFDKERQQYQEEIQKLLQKVAKLRQELLKHEDTNHNEDINDEGDTNIQDPYVGEAFQKIESIKRDTHDVKKKIGEFVGSAQDDKYLQINEQLIKNLIKLDNIVSNGFNVVRKRRKEAMRYVEKCQDELKSKV